MATKINAQLSELEQLQLEAKKVSNKSLESTRNMKELCEESHIVAIKTLENLDHQGNQLDRVNEGLDDMRSEMRQTEKSLNGMEKFCGLLCICPSFKSAKIKENKSSKNRVGKSRSKGSMVPDKVSSGPYIQRITNDALEDEMEDNMKDVGNALNNLKNMAEVMGEVVTDHNSKIEDIRTKSTKLDIKIGSANKRTVKMLK